MNLPGRPKDELHSAQRESGTTSAGLGRRGLVAGVAVLALSGGVGWSWWRTRETTPQMDAGDLDALWGLRFARPQGGELIMSELRGKALLINFWATWCPPCIKEMPELDRFARAQGQRVQVVGLAIDRLEPVQEFLTRHPVSFAVGLAGMDGTELARSLGNPAGALPFTVLLDAKGRIVQRRLGETRHADLEAWAKLL
ncbi:MAG: TlpA family protein disulfide reductase [Rubrivivax sp.]